MSSISTARSSVAVAVEVARHDRDGAVVDVQAVAGRSGQSELRVGEAAVAVGGQHGEAVRPLIDDREVVAAVAGEVARDQADRLGEGTDWSDCPEVALGRTGPCWRGSAETG